MTAALVQPTSEMSKFIRLELNEDLNTRDQDLAAIKDWLRKQPHLPDEWDDFRIMTFLRGSSFSLEKCKKKLDMYFTMRAACPEFFTDRNISTSDMKYVLSKVQGAPLPGLTSNGLRVTLCRALDKDVDPAHMITAFKLAMMFGDIRLKEEVVGIAGDIYVLDASVISAQNITKVSPMLLKKFFICVQEAYPVKLKQVHVVNASSLVDTCVSIVKPFLKQKLRERVFIHSDISTLYEHIPKEVLPEEYGGTCGSLVDINNAWAQKLAEYTDWFKEQESVKANEALRPGKPTNYDELFGIDGSFRQLSID